MDDTKKEEKLEEITENTEEIVEETPQEPDFEQKYTRLLAEFANYQRQKDAELKSMAQYGNSKLLTKVIDIMDDLEMGLMQETISEETKSVLNLLKEKISNLLMIEGVEEIKLNPGDEFNANECEAIHAVDDENNKGKIIQIARKGYKNSDRVLRTAKVIVGK